jgi:hypothetical protein
LKLPNGWVTATEMCDTAKDAVLQQWEIQNRACGMSGW